MTSEPYDDIEGQFQRSFVGRILFWLGVLAAIASITSLGENLFRGWVVIDKFIDTWHSIFAPTLAWLNEHVFARIDIEVRQIEVDVIAALALIARYMAMALGELNPNPKEGQRRGNILFFLIWVCVSIVIILFDVFQLSFGAQLNAGQYARFQMAGVFVAVFFLFGKSRWLMLRMSARLLGLIAAFLLLAMLIEFNTHADENLPYIERWLTAWDDIFVEE